MIKVYKQWYAGIAVSIAIAILAFWINSTDLGAQLELKTLDYRFRKFTMAEKADTNIVLIAIDNNSLRFFSEHGISWPWPRSFYAHITDYLAATGAKGVIYDLLLYEPDLNRDETNAEETDGAFAEAIRSNGKVILAATLTSNASDSIPDITPFALPLKSSAETALYGYKGGKVPIDTLRQAAHSLGIINIEPDTDGILRRAQTVHIFKGSYYPQMALSAWLLDQEYGATIEIRKKSLNIGGYSVPIDRKGRYLINWYGEGGPGRVFRWVPFSAVIQSASAMRAGELPELSPELFRNKYAIIGAHASGIEDLKPTPFVDPYPGMEIWATILSNLIHRDFIRVVPWWLNLVNIVLAAFLTFIIFTRLPLRISNPLLMVIPLYIFGSVLYLWAEHRILANLSMPLIGFVLTYLYAATVSYLMEGRARKEIRKVFTRYLSSEVIDRLLKDPDSVRIGGDEVYATVLFSDLYDFTSFSEGKSATVLVEFLNEYFDELTQIILDHNGLLDKYTGDGIMAIFGVPIPRDDHAILACRAALSHHDFALRLFADGKQNTSASDLHLRTRMGLSSGPIVVGNIGSRLRMDYTAIGDDVNLAARLEGVNKIYKTGIILSQSTHQLVSDSFICRELDCLRVKGRKEPTRIYELLADKGAERPGDYDWIEQYHTALRAYQRGAWTEARDAFEALAEGPQKDHPSKVMSDRCAELLNNPPEGWDGVLTLEFK